MNKYTIYCTKEQTKKALELGAPIEPTCYGDGFVKQLFVNDSTNPFRSAYYDIPTADQMIGWLEEQGFYIRLSSSGGSVEIDFKCICEEVGHHVKMQLSQPLMQHWSI